MNFKAEIILNSLKKMDSSFLAYSTCKAKIEKPLLFRLSQEIEKQLEEEGSKGLHASFEFTYNNFYGDDAGTKKLGLKRSDLVIVDIDEEENIHSVIEVKLYYTFDYFKESMKNSIREDLHKIGQIHLNLNKKPLKKYFILFLAHYATEEVHKDVFAYGGGHNREVRKNNNSHENLFEKVLAETKAFFQDNLQEKYGLIIHEPISVTLGQFKKTDIRLLSFLVEFT